MENIVQMVVKAEDRVFDAPRRSFTHRQKKLLMAQAFAKVFVRAVQKEIDGERPDYVDIAIAELEAALAFTRQDPLIADGICRCGHDRFWHSDKSTECVSGGCPCRHFIQRGESHAG